jgi:hypothetical protein
LQRDAIDVEGADLRAEASVASALDLGSRTADRIQETERQRARPGPCRQQRIARRKIPQPTHALGGDRKIGRGRLEARTNGSQPTRGKRDEHARTDRRAVGAALIPIDHVVCTQRCVTGDQRGLSKNRGGSDRAEPNDQARQDPPSSATNFLTNCGAGPKSIRFNDGAQLLIGPDNCKLQERMRIIGAFTPVRRPFHAGGRSRPRCGSKELVAAGSGH